MYLWLPSLQGTLCVCWSRWQWVVTARQSPWLGSGEENLFCLKFTFRESIFKLVEVSEAQQTGYNLSWYKYLQLTCRICCHMIWAYYCEKLQLMSTQLEELLMRELKASSLPSCRFRAPGIRSEAQSLICVFWLGSKSCLIYTIPVWLL